MSNDALLPPSNFTDPTATYLNLSCLDLLMIELVPLAYRLANDIDATTRSDIDGNIRVDGAIGNQIKPNNATSRSSMGLNLSTNNVMAETKKMEEDEERDAVFFRLEALGYRVGQGLVERFSRDRPRFTNTLDVIKFICKDLWVILFRKQLDNLKTNHRGVYVLTDNSFRPFTRMSTEVGGQAVIRAQPFLWFPCGIIRGALANMGIDATVQAETNELPAASFQIKSNTKS
ncbi:Trafficking protein particle complex subunit 6B [Erysiphe neolycopersici]|uniref:Trafficking protein particle complex subunit 6B n=1 Tax=Erysiphe neolycopersici TaxID=212602 RepID=A0A420HXD9_9PEZI|nr:Trafficking protein particle complex subunit 6B [Erysiphe neolycopersici]